MIDKPVPPEVGLAEPEILDACSHRPVEDENPFLEGVAQLGQTVSRHRHDASSAEAC